MDKKTTNPFHYLERVCCFFRNGLQLPFYRNYASISMNVQTPRAVPMVYLLPYMFPVLCRHLMEYSG